MTDDLTDKELDFLRDHRGGIGAILGSGPSPKGDVRDAVAQLMAELEVRYPSRTERLLIVAAFAELATAERDRLLDEVIDTRFRWAADWKGGLQSMAWNPYDIDWLASAANLSRQTVRKRVDRVARASYDAAVALAEEVGPS
jgi:hypothetical protein